MSYVTCQFFFLFVVFFLGQRFEAIWWRVCYQQGLSRLVFYLVNFFFALFQCFFVVVFLLFCTMLCFNVCTNLWTNHCSKWCAPFCSNFALISTLSNKSIGTYFSKCCAKYCNRLWPKWSSSVSHISKQGRDTMPYSFFCSIFLIWQGGGFPLFHVFQLFL